MKKILFVVMLLLGIGIMAGCNKTDGGNIILGSWKCVYSEDDINLRVGCVLTFEEGGTVLFDGFPYINYRYDTSTQTIKMGGSGYFKVLSITSKSMSWADAYYESNREIFKFERQ